MPCRGSRGNATIGKLFLARQHQQVAIWPWAVMGDLVLNAIGIVTVGGAYMTSCTTFTSDVTSQESP